MDGCKQTGLGMMFSFFMFIINPYKEKEPDLYTKSGSSLDCILVRRSRKVGVILREYSSGSRWI